MKLKKLTSTQRMTLKMNGIDNDQLGNWMYVKTETKSVDGSKSSAKNSDKRRFMVIQNVDTQEVKRIEI